MALAAVVVLGAVPAAAQTALPEVVLVLDNSQSMQYGLHEDVAPDCTKGEKSRWTAVREMLAGEFFPFTCKAEALPSHPDQANPPKQSSGGATCIPGVKHSLFEPHKATYASSMNQPVGDYSWKHNKVISNLAQVKVQVDDNDVVLPYFAVDLSKIPDNQDWVAVTLTVFTMLPAKTNESIELYLGAVSTTPKAFEPKKFVCDVTGSGFNPVSPPTKINNKSGFPTVFEVNSTYIKTLQAAKKAGMKEAYFTLLPVDFALDQSCTTVAKKGVNFELLLEGPATAMKPTVAIGVGKECQPEGPLVHYAPAGVQLKNGILDVFGPTAKYALLTGDNTLSAKVDGTGQYSFADDTSSVWGDINIGAQSPFNSGSQSVKIPHTDDLATRALTYQAILDKVATIKPIAGTPLGQLLRDTDAYFGPGKFMDLHFQSTTQDAINGDPLFACRQRMVVVFSDGGANLDSGNSDGRAAAISAAAKLNSKGIEVHVIAVGHPAKQNAKGNLGKDLDFLDELANAGGTGKAVRATTVKQVVDYMRPVLNATTAKGEVFTRTHFTGSTGVKDESLHSFQHKSVFQLADPLLTSGIFEQRVFKCGAGCVDLKEPGRAGVCDVIDYEKRIKQRGVPRRLYTMKSGQRVTLKTGNLTADDMAIPKIGLAPKLTPDPLTGSCGTQAGTFILSDPQQRNDYRDHLILTLRGDKGSCRENVPLGAPAKAQPVILEPADRMGIREPSFLVYKGNPIADPPFSIANPPGSDKRATMMFAATHDGFLHAFRTDNNPDIDVKDQLQAGDEMWAWLPGFNLRRARALRLVSTADASYLGAAVVAGHFLLDRTGGSAAEQALRWRAVVIGGAGEAGSGYFALDVTSPDDPELLWEITPERHCWGRSKLGAASGPNCAAVSTFEEMGRSTALPAVANLFFTRNGVTKQRAVAILAGGMDPNKTSLQNFGVDGLGKQVVYVVSLENGELLRKFTVDDIDTSNMPSPLLDKKDMGHFITEPACFNNAPGQIVTRCFLGDSRGMVWRLDLSDIDSGQWKMQFFHDAYAGTDSKAQFTFAATSTNRVPVLSKPSLATDRSGRLVVVYGTGDLDEESKALRRHQVYSVTETFTLSALGVATRADFKANWVLTLNDNTRFVGPPVIFGGNAYWSSYSVSSTGLCKSGTARIWGVDYNNRGQQNPGNGPAVAKGGFPVPTDDPTKQIYTDSQQLGTYKPSPVDITPVPACVGGCAPGDANCVVGNTSALSGNKPQFEIGVGVAGNTQAKSQQAKKGAAPRVGTINRKLNAPRSTSVVTGWDLLLD